MSKSKGLIKCHLKPIPFETPLFELPFSAVISSSSSLAGYGAPVFIKTRMVSESGANVQVSRQAAAPCLLLAEPSKTVTVMVNAVNEGLTTTLTPISLTGCWWYSRPGGVVTIANVFGLAHDKPSNVYTREHTDG